jgi:hypothetical protein
MIGSIGWRNRSAPLSPTAVAATGVAAVSLARRLLSSDDEALIELRGVAGERILLLTGNADQLPWVDGAVYLGRDPMAPSLLLPTHSEPDVAPALFERAVHAAFPNLSAPLAVLPAESLVISVCEARPVQRARLNAWLDGSR